MALRDQPYLPLYVQDFLTDEKLIECSAAATGIYIKIMCIMHKSDEYGTILLKEKDKISQSVCYNFANKLTKFLPYSDNEINIALQELISEGVLFISGDKLIQKRMVRDNEISIKRSEAGSKGGFAKSNNIAKGMANVVPNTEDENEDETDTIINYSGVLENFHLYCDRMSKVSKLSEQRKKHIAARFKEFDYETIIEVLKKAGKSDFLCGKNDKAWKADFDWIFNPTNFLKIMEGKYENKLIQSPKSTVIYDRPIPEDLKRIMNESR